MKKFTALMLSLALLFACFLPAMAEERKISVVATIFPVYDWAREVIGDSANVELTLLQDSGVDLHSYQPTIQDIAKVSTSDVFVYVGGESDEWVEDVLQSAMNPNLKAINLVDAMGEDIKTEEVVEGMEHDHDHEDSEDHKEHDHEHEHEDEADEHVWLSLRNAGKLTGR